MSDILEIAITGNEHNRRFFEKKLVAQLKSVGVDAIASEKAISREGIAIWTRLLKMDFKISEY